MLKGINMIRYLGMFLIILTAIQSHAQDTSNTIGHVSIASPNAASLGKYGDIPISYNTGIPQISIPIYTVESGSLKLPVSLSYHASGLKVQEQASWVGAGWSLNAGGMITRTVVGAADDRGANFNITTNGYFSDYGYNSYLNTTPTGNIPDDNAFARGAKDGEPDLYFFNFGGYTGKFYFNDDRTPMIVPEEDFKITPYYTLGPGFTGFIITTPEGVKYYFGATGNHGPVTPTETTIPSTTANGMAFANEATSSWFLNKIMSADGMDSITLNYTNEGYSYYTLSLAPVLSTNYQPYDNSKMGVTLVKNFVQGVRLTQISFPNGTVTLTPSASLRTDMSAGSSVDNSLNDANNTNAYSLGSISVRNNNGFCKKDSFYYGYFVDSSALDYNYFNGFSIYNLHHDEYRLRLDSLQELSCDGTIKIPSHKFSYFSGLVPRKLSFGVDHWGFYNGITTNDGLVPTYTITTSGTMVNYPGANRDPAFPAMENGTLQKITYPTGGSSQLVFEANNTYTSFSSPEEILDLNTSIGYDGGTGSQTTPFTMTGTTWQANQSNTTTYSATLQIKNSGGAVVQSFSIPANSSTQPTLSIGAGSYTAILSWVTTPPGLPGGSGVIFSIDQTTTVVTSQNAMVGGLRIKTMTDNDGLTSNNVVTNYAYTTGNIVGGQTSGVLYSRPTYIQVIRNDLLALVWPYASSNGCASIDGVGGHSFFISPSSIQPMATFQGNHVGYNEVWVTQTGNGSSVYRYYGSNTWDNNTSDICIRSLTQSSSCDPAIPNYPAPPLPFEFMRGEIKYEGHFNQSGKIVKETYYYPVYTNDSLTTPGHISTNIPGLYSYTEYNLQSASKTKYTTTENDYDQVSGNALQSSHIKYFGSQFHHKPTRMVATTSTADSLCTNIKYVYDFRIASCDAIPDSLVYYMNTISADYHNMDSAVNACTPQVNNGSNCRAPIYTTYRENLSSARVNFIKYRLRSFSDSVALLTTCYVNSEPTADTLLKPILRLMDEYDNSAIEVSNWKDLNLLHASFTRYDTSLSPVGFVYPGRTKLINLQTPSSTFTNASVSGNTISKDNRYIDESTYNFINGNPVQVLPHDGVAISYIWDYLNTEPVAKVTNATSNQIAATSFETSGKGNWTFTGTPNADPSSPTGNNCYNLGQTNGSITMPGLSSSATYIISYWIKGTSALSITGTQSGYPVKGKTIGLWTYFEHKITSQTTVTVSGTGYIDELRLYPSAGQMTTYTYAPLVGMTTSCDVENKISYYFYDAMGRLKWIKDQDGNIIKTIQYHYLTQTTQY